jgi:hypothetical protein
MDTDGQVRRQGLGARRAAAILPSSLIYHPSSIIRNSNREVREVREEKTFSSQRRKGHKGRNAKKEVARRWIGSSTVRVMRGHKGKIFTTEITEGTES